MENFVFIDEFKRGPEHIIKSHIFSADSIRKSIYTVEISDKELKKIDDMLSKIIELSDEAIIQLNEEQLDEKSRKEYRNFFSSDYDIKLSKVNFLMLKNTYEILKKYNIHNGSAIIIDNKNMQILAYIGSQKSKS